MHLNIKAIRLGLLSKLRIFWSSEAERNDTQSVIPKNLPFLPSAKHLRVTTVSSDRTAAR